MGGSYWIWEEEPLRDPTPLGRTHPSEDRPWNLADHWILPTEGRVKRGQAVTSNAGFRTRCG